MEIATFFVAYNFEYFFFLTNGGLAGSDLVYILLSVSCQSLVSQSVKFPICHCENSFRDNVKSWCVLTKELMHLDLTVAQCIGSAWFVSL